MVQVTVTIDQHHVPSIGDVADVLRRAGMQVDQVLDDVGVVVGTIDPAAEHSLRSVDGVQSVDRALSFQLPPPDAPIQ
jgi:hypothetical protein